MKHLFKATIIGIFISLALTACVRVSMDQSISALQGESLNTVINLMGPPDGKTIVNGRTFYVWSSNYSDTETKTVTSYGDGYNFDQTPVNIEVPYTKEYYCKLTLEVNQQNRVVSWNRRSNRGGCDEYYSKLRSLYLTKQNNIQHQN